MESHVLDVDRHQFGAAQTVGEAEQQKCTILHAG